MSPNNLNNNAALLPEETIERAKLFNSTLLSDAQNCSGAMDPRIKSVSNQSIMLGTAITVDLSPGDNLYLHQAIYSSDEGYIIVVDGKDHKNNAYLGELMALAAQAKNVEGIIIDGLVRDKLVLKNMNLPIFAKGFIPNGPHKNVIGKLNVPISCGRVTVQPGDLVVGDDDGVTIVPRENIKEVFARAEEKRRYEKERLTEINLYHEKKEKGQFPGKLEPSWLKKKIGNH